jgi:hypothetical protein
MRQHADAVFVCLVDDRAVEIGSELLDRAAAVVDPDLDHVDFFGGKLLHVRARLGLRGDAIGGVAHGSARSRARHAEAAPCRAKERARRHLRAQLVGEVAARRAGLEDRGHAVIGEAVERIEEVLARVVLRPEAQPLAVAHVHMRVDERRDHGLAGEVHMRRAGRDRDRAASANLRDPVAFDHESGILDRCAAVARDEPRAFEYRLRARGRGFRGQHQAGSDQPPPSCRMHGPAPGGSSQTSAHEVSIKHGGARQAIAPRPGRTSCAARTSMVTRAPRDTGPAAICRRKTWCGASRAASRPRS